MKFPPPPDIEPLLTTDETAVVCKVNEKTVIRWIKAGDLPAIRLGRQYRIRRRDLELFLRERWIG